MGFIHFDSLCWSVKRFGGFNKTPARIKTVVYISLPERESYLNNNCTRSVVVEEVYAIRDFPRNAEIVFSHHKQIFRMLWVLHFGSQ